MHDEGVDRYVFSIGLFAMDRRGRFGWTSTSTISALETISFCLLDSLLCVLISIRLLDSSSTMIMKYSVLTRGTKIYHHFFAHPSSCSAPRTTVSMDAAPADARWSVWSVVIFLPRDAKSCSPHISQIHPGCPRTDLTSRLQLTLLPRCR